MCSRSGGQLRDGRNEQPPRRLGGNWTGTRWNAVTHDYRLFSCTHFHRRVLSPFSLLPLHGWTNLLTKNLTEFMFLPCQRCVDWLLFLFLFLVLVVVFFFFFCFFCRWLGRFRWASLSESACCKWSVSMVFVSPLWMLDWAQLASPLRIGRVASNRLGD